MVIMILLKLVPITLYLLHVLFTCTAHYFIIMCRSLCRSFSTFSTFSTEASGQDFDYEQMLNEKDE